MMIKKMDEGPFTDKTPVLPPTCTHSHEAPRHQHPQARQQTLTPAALTHHLPYNMLRVALLTATVVVAGVAASPAISPQAAAMYNPELFQGDITGIAGQEPGQERAAILGKQFLWPNATVPYVFGSSITSSQKTVILNAMNDFHSKTCIKFVPQTAEANYVEIFSDGIGCSSAVGMMGGKQNLSLAADGCIYVGAAIHELMHAVGFYHERTRNDRDNYVTIQWENILKDMEYNFDKDENSQYVGEGYNYDSIMHYSSYAFSKNEEMTIVPKDPNVVLVDNYNKTEMEHSDANQIKNLYGC